MSRKTKGRTGCYQATPKSSISKYHFTNIASHIKAFIVTLALCEWLIREGELRDE